jgi:hypothetical protein
VTENDIDNWVARLRQPEQCESDCEKAVMKAIKGGLRASAPAAEIDQLALKRLHNRIEQEGLYRPRAISSRRLYRYGTAAALLVGVALVIDLPIFDRAVVDQYSMREAPNIAKDTEMARYEALAAAPEKAASSREADELPPSVHAEAGGQYLVDSGQKDDARSANALAKAERHHALLAARAMQDSDIAQQDVSAKAARQNAAPDKLLTTEYRRLVLTAIEWQALRKLTDEGVDFARDSENGPWVLLLKNQMEQQRWRKALPKVALELSWPIDQRIKIDVVVIGDRDE